jgi:nitroimidazol reductase NimA-like FMN-containing flavoprotein (pyridoxamine 5'-phosphate oxidase superfamily)
MLKTMDEVRCFMNRERLAGLSTINSRNEPCVVPVFFTYDGGSVYVQTARSTAKVRHILKNSNVAITIYHDDEAVIIRGIARIIDDQAFIRRTQEHIDKYGLRLDEQGRDSLGIPLFDSRTRCVVEITPKRVLFW